MTPPRDDLIRMLPAPAARFAVRAADPGAGEDPDAGRLMVGYPIVFNTWTEIAGWEGNFLERIDPKSLNKTLKERGDRVKVLFDHGFDFSIGDKPLGKPRAMTPDDTGLYTETPLSRTSYNEDIIALINDEAIDGMSFRFSVVAEEWRDEPDPSDDNPKGLPERTIKELKLYEFGPVTFPAYEATTVGVRNREMFDVWRRTRHSGPVEAASGTSADAPAVTTRLTKRQRLSALEGFRNGRTSRTSR